MSRNKEEHEKYLEDMKLLAKEILESENNTKQFLIDSGIYDSDGNPAYWWKDQDRE